MNINIGIRGATRELSMTDVEMTEDELMATVSDATAEDRPVRLKDAKGRVLIIPIRALGYIEVSDKEKRPVGFGILNQGEN